MTHKFQSLTRSFVPSFQEENCLFFFSFLRSHWIELSFWHTLTQRKFIMILHSIFSSGKSHSGTTNQQDAFLLKAILTEMTDRQEECAKMKEAIERLEVCFHCQFSFCYTKQCLCDIIVWFSFAFLTFINRVSKKNSKMFHENWKANDIAPNDSRNKWTI